MRYHEVHEEVSPALLVGAPIREAVMAVRRRDNPYEPEFLARLTYLDVDQGGAYVNLGRSKMYELIRSGVIPSVRLGNQIRIPRAALDARLAELSKETVT